MAGHRCTRPAAVAALALAVVAGLGLSGCERESDAADAAAPPPPTVTTAHPLVTKLTEWDEFTGRFEPVDRVELRPRVQGYLDSVHFEDGQLVEEGQLLFVIDPRPYQATLDRTKAEISEAEARVELARLEQQRAAQLVTTSAVARATLDERNAELNTAQAMLGAAQAQLRQSELDLGFTRITAPIKGRISNRRVDVGNLVTSSTILTSIVALDPIYFYFDMSESDFLAYQRAVGRGELPSTRDNDTLVDIRLGDEEGWTRRGRMNFVDNVVDQGTGTVRARAVLDNPDLFLTPGQFGVIRVPGSPEYDAILIPDEAIVADQARKIVLTVADDGTVHPKEIRQGPREQGLRIVRRGLNGDDRVIIDGVMRSRPGAKVNVEEGKIEPVPPAEPAG